MPHKPKPDPNDPNWWRHEPEYTVPETKYDRTIPTEAEIIEYYAEVLRTNSAAFPRAVIERYVIVKDDPQKLRQFLDLMLDMHIDGSLYSHLPDDENVESEALPSDEEEQAEIDTMLRAFYTQPTGIVVEFFELERYAKALSLLKNTGQ